MVLKIYLGLEAKSKNNNFFIYFVHRARESTEYTVLNTHRCIKGTTKLIYSSPMQILTSIKLFQYPLLRIRNSPLAIGLARWSSGKTSALAMERSWIFSASRQCIQLKLSHLTFIEPFHIILPINRNYFDPPKKPIHDPTSKYI